MDKGIEAVAEAIHKNFTSPSVSNRNLEPANVVDALYIIGLALQGSIVEAIHRHAEAVEKLADAIRESRDE